MLAVAAMTAVAVKQMEQRAGKQQHEGQELDQVGAMFRYQEVTCDEEESPEDPSSRAAVSCVAMLVRVVGHEAACSAYSLTRRSRKALLTTDTELIAIAAAAKIGESSNPKAGYRTPAATGTPSAL